MALRRRMERAPRDAAAGTPGQAGQPRPGDGEAPEYVTLLSHRRYRLRGLRPPYSDRACRSPRGPTIDHGRGRALIYAPPVPRSAHRGREIPSYVEPPTECDSSVE